MLFLGFLFPLTSFVAAQDISIPIRSKFDLNSSRINFGPDIGWADSTRRTVAPPPPPPGAFDVRVLDQEVMLFEDIRVFRDSTWYKWEVSLSPLSTPLGLVDTTYIFFDRCELLNNVREAYIVDLDSNIVIDMIRDSVAIIDDKFRRGTTRRFSVWFLSKNTISDDPPQILADLPDAVLDPNEPRPYLINVSSFFASSTGSQLRFSAQTNTDLVNLRTTESGLVELTLKEGVEDTSVVVTVTAFGAGCGFVEQDFFVDIPAIINLPIDLLQEIPDFDLQGNFPTRVLIGNLNNYFNDQNGTQPQFAISYNESLVSLSLSGNAVLASSVNGVFNVQTMATIIATDGEFSISESFLIKIGEPNRIPTKTSDIPVIIVEPNFGLLEALYFRNYFDDPDGDNLLYSLSYDQTKITAFTQGDTLFLASVAGIKNETIDVELTISDGLLELVDSFRITVNDNLPPQIATELADSLVLAPGFSTFTWHNLNELFLDPENDELSFTVNNQNPEFATITISNNELLITEIDGVVNQSVNHAVSAFDGVNTVSKDLKIHILEANAAPAVNTSTVQIVRNYTADLVISVRLDDYFSDPNGDSLIYTFTARSNVIDLSNQSGGTTNIGQELSINLDADSAILRISPLLNSRLDEEIFVEGSDGEFSVGLVVELNIFPEGEVLPAQGDNLSNKKLYRTFPNPANVNSFVNIIYELPESATVDIDLAEINVYNILGRFVKRLVLQRQEAGVYSVSFDTRGLAAGTYIYTLRTSTGLISRKLTLID